MFYCWWCNLRMKCYKIRIFSFVLYFALIDFCFNYLEFTNKFIFCLHLYGGMKMNLYFFVRDTFLKIRIERQLWKLKTFVYRIIYSTNAKCDCMHNREIKKTNNYFSIRSSLMQKMYENMVVTYFKILFNIFFTIFF